MEHTTLTLGSLFDGSGGFPLGGMLAGITPVWASEIEPFPIRVTTKRLPFMKHYGDISQMDGGKIEPVDIITFGSPCTNLSIAGRREGLEGAQSSLFYQAIRVIKEMRCATNGRYPRWICWENVIGAFSSNGGFDFKKVLEEIIGICEPGAEVPMPEKDRWPYADIYMGDGWSIAYRTFDAQHWGVPQRRRRIYLVGDLAGRCAGQVLFESEGLSGYSAESFRSWQRTARDSAAGLGAAGCAICLNDQGGSRMDVSVGVSGTLRAQMDGHPPCIVERRSEVYENHSQDTRYTGPLDTAPTVSSTYGTGGNNQPFVVQEDTPKTLKIRCGCEGGGKGALIQEDVSATLSCNNDQTLFVPFCKGTRPHSAQEGQVWKPGEVANTLNTFDLGESRCSELAVRAFSIGAAYSGGMLSDNPHAGIYEADSARTLDQSGGDPACNQGGIAVVEGPTYAVTTGKYTQVSEEQAPTLMARDFKDPTAVNRGYSVRRLTPTECARLQGFADWWCADLDTPEPTEADIAFWTEVWETHRRVVSGSSKPKSRNQIIKWLQHPHSDAAEYKMWGNGVALPNVFFVLAGIVWSTQFESC
ncbi:MAG: DNA cytosine methyltransferase [Ruminococcus flavefaciens]|nr:DNA cytosine methyltransferase [Ruminococcus flavefaciens]